MSDSKRRWNEETGHRWAEHAAAIDAQLHALGQRLIVSSDIDQGSELLEVGCGAGALSLELAATVGEMGRVVALDVSTPLLAVARERLAASPFRNVDLLCADAQTITLEEPSVFDRILSRFGVMFFDDSVAAFQNLRRLLKPAGALHFLCWGRLQQNDWATLPRQILRRFREEERADPGAPGPFRFQHEERLVSMLGEAGFTEIAVERLRGEFLLGGPGTLESTMRFCGAIGPAHQMHDLPEPERVAAFDALRDELRRRLTDDGVLSRYEVLLVRAKR